MKKGTIVRIAEKWRDPNESAETLYEVAENNGDRSVIALKGYNVPLRPTQTVMDYMIEEA